MKKTIITSAILVSLLGLMVILPVAVGAALNVPSAGSATTNISPQNLSVEDALTNITNWFFVIVLVIAVLFLLVAGFQFITAGGDPDRVNSARQNVMYAMVGVAVAVLAKGIVSLVQGILKK